MNNNIEVRVRPARFEDVPRIVELHDACHAGTPAEGFLIDRGEPADLVTYLKSPDKLCLVAEDESGSVGFLQANRVIEQLDTVAWSRPELRPGCRSRGHWHVDNVAVRRTVKNRGVGRTLYAALTGLTGADSLSAYVVKSPLVNEASLAFHLRAGFLPAGEFHMEEFCGVRDYRSLLLVNPAAACESTAAPLPACESRRFVALPALVRAA